MTWLNNPYAPPSMDDERPRERIFAGPGATELAFISGFVERCEFVGALVVLLGAMTLFLAFFALVTMAWEEAAAFATTGVILVVLGAAVAQRRFWGAVAVGVVTCALLSVTLAYVVDATPRTSSPWAAIFLALVYVPGLGFMISHASRMPIDAIHILRIGCDWSELKSITAQGMPASGGES